MRQLQAIALFTIAYAMLTTSAFAQPGIAWQTDFDAAKQAAAAEGKLLLVHFWTPSCGPCRVLENTVFNQPNVAQVVAASYVPVKLNADENANFATSLGITRVPTDVVLTPQGQIVDKFVSQQQPMAYISQVHKVATDYKTTTGRQFQQVTATGGPSQPVNPTYGDLSISDLGTAQQPSQQQNPFAKAAAVPAPSVPATPPATATENRYAIQPAAAPTSNNPYTQQPAVSQNVAPTSPTADQESIATAEPQLPAGSPPLGFDGYCPVTMKNEWRWQKGDVRWGAVHRGRTYLFVSQAARDEFLKPGNGDVYSPVLGGVDPVLAIDGGKSVPGTRQFSVEYAGNFYLFSSEETLSQFWSSADRYANGVRQAMAPQQAPANYR